MHIKKILIGDLCIGKRGYNPPNTNSRTKSWIKQTCSHEFDIWLSQPNGIWNGYPCTWVEETNYQLIILGDIHSKGDWNISAEQLLEKRELINSISGHFLIIAIHKHQQKIYVWSNRFGSLHAYISESRNIIFSTHYFTINGDFKDNNIDVFGIRCFFRWGFFPENHTYTKNVKLIPPAHIFTYENDVWLGNQYWHWYYQEPQIFSEKKWLSLFDERLNVIKEATGFSKDKIIPISGGLDSRTIFAKWSSHDEEKKLTLLSYGYSKQSIETYIAKKVAKTRNYPINTFSIEPYLHNEMNRIILSVEGFQDLSISRQAALAPTFNHENSRIIGGHWGDVWFDTMHVDQKSIHQAHQVEGLIFKKIYRPELKWLTDHCQLDLFSKNYPSDEEWIISRIDNYKDIHSLDMKVKAFKTDHWSHRWTCASVRMYQSSIFPMLPFYDLQLSDLFLQTPSKAHQNRMLQIKYLCNYHPDLAQILWQDSGVNLFQTLSPGIFTTINYQANRILRKLFFSEQIKRNYEAQLLHTKTRKIVTEYLLDATVKDAYFFHNDIEKLLNHFYTNPFQNKEGYVITSLLTFFKAIEHLKQGCS